VTVEQGSQVGLPEARALLAREVIRRARPSEALESGSPGAGHRTGLGPNPGQLVAGEHPK